MELGNFFKSVIDQDTAPVVICDLNHIIVYMNPSAKKRYEKQGGAALTGKSLKKCHNKLSCELIDKALDWFGQSCGNNIVYESRNDKENKDVYIVALRNDDGELIGYYEKHEYRSAETKKPYENLI